MEPLRWEIRVPLFRNRFLLRDLALAVGIPFGLLVLFIVAVSGGDVLGTDAKYPLLMLVLLFFLAWLLLTLFYRGRYLHGFILDDAGATFYTPREQRRRNGALYVLLLILGILSGKPTLAGAGCAAKSGETLRIRWSGVRGLRIYPKQRAILIRGGFAQKIVLFCTEKNFEQAKNLAESRVLAQK